MKANRMNPRGYFEFEPFVLMNDEILSIFGGDWKMPPDLPVGWPDSPAVAAVMDQAKALIDRHFQGVRLWGFKDPRLCFTLPFWRKAVNDRPIDCVIVVRNPLDVALSLSVMAKKMSSLKANTALWLRYMMAAMEVGKGAGRALFLYERFLDHFDEEFGRLSAFVGGEARVEEARAFVSGELRRHRSSPEDLEDPSKIIPEAKAFYTEVLAAWRKESGH